MNQDQVFRELLRRRVPSSAWVAWFLMAALAVLPFLWPGTKQLDVAAKILIFALLVVGYDLLLGYTGVVSFAHTMFFAIGAYGLAIACEVLGPGWSSLMTGAAAALAVSFLLAVIVGLFSLRFSAIYFAMVSLAIASAFATFVVQMSHVTGGDDGLNLRLPEVITPAFVLFDYTEAGIRVDGRLILYYSILLINGLVLWALTRFVDSPFGKVLEVIRENAFRVDAIGLKPLYYRLATNVISAMVATLAGCLFAMWVRYTGPDAVLSMELMLDVLLILVIGGMGSLYGSVIGAAVFVGLQAYLKDLVRWISEALGHAAGFDGTQFADRWMLWLGVLFIVCVYKFPEGIAGRLARLDLRSRHVNALQSILRRFRHKR